MVFALIKEEHRSLIIYKGQQIGYIASTVDQTKWFAIEGMGSKGVVVTDFHPNPEEALEAFKKYRWTGRRKNAKR